MKKISYFSALLVTAMLLFSSCSDSTTEPTTDNVQMQAELTSTRVTSTQYKGGASILAGATVDSLHISKVKLMISEVKLHHKTSGVDEKVKTDPIILIVDGSGPSLVATSTLPTGTYDKVNFKFHRLNDPEAATYASNPDFADFVTTDRYTIIFEGTLYTGGSPTAFIYGSRVEEDLKFDVSDFELTTNSIVKLAIALDPVKIFRDKDTFLILDPRDTENQNRIDNEVKASLNVLRK